MDAIAATTSVTTKPRGAVAAPRQAAATANTVVAPPPATANDVAVERAVAAPRRAAATANIVVAPRPATANDVAVDRAVAAPRQATTDPFTTPTTNNDLDFEEVQVCWLCGGTPCDWLEYSPELLQEIEEKFPKDSNGNRVDCNTRVK